MRRNAHVIRSLFVDVERCPVGTHPVDTKPKFIEGSGSKGVNIADHAVLITRVRPGGQERIPAHDGSQKRWVAEQRSQVAIAGEKLVLVANPVVNADVEVICIVS